MAFILTGTNYFVFASGLVFDISEELYGEKTSKNRPCCYLLFVFNNSLYLSGRRYKKKYL